MKRRVFLEGAGWLAVLGSGTLAAEGQVASSKPASGEKETPIAGAKRKVLITSAESKLAQALAAELGKQHQVRLTGQTKASSQFPFVQSDLGHDAATNELVRGIDAIVHVAETPRGASEAEQIDVQSRCTYNLLRAAAQEGVRQFVYPSSLEMMTAYDQDYEVAEDWRPLPRPGAGLASYLGECVCREFAREGKPSVVVLRLGRVIERRDASDKNADDRSIEIGDVVQAVSLALAAGAREPGLGPWSVFHLGGDGPRPRFASTKAASVLGYNPRKLQGR